VTRPFGNTLLVIRMLAYLGNTNPTMAMRPCVIGGIGGKRVSAQLEDRRVRTDVRCEPLSLSLSLSLSLPENNGISRRNKRPPLSRIAASRISLLILRRGVHDVREGRRSSRDEIRAFVLSEANFRSNFHRLRFIRMRARVYTRLSIYRRLWRHK